MQKLFFFLGITILFLPSINLVFADINSEQLIINTKLVIWNATSSTSITSFNIQDGGIKIQASSLAQEKNYTFYRTGSSAQLTVSLTSININNTNFTMNNAVPSDATLNVTGSQVAHLYLNGIKTDANIHYTGGINVLTIGSTRTVEVQFIAPPNNFSQVLVDSLAISDSISKLTSKLLNENITINDSISNTLTPAIQNGTSGGAGGSSWNIPSPPGQNVTVPVPSNATNQNITITNPQVNAIQSNQVMNYDTNAMISCNGNNQIVITNIEQQGNLLNLKLPTTPITVNCSDILTQTNNLIPIQLTLPPTACDTTFTIDCLIGNTYSTGINYNVKVDTGTAIIHTTYQVIIPPYYDPIYISTILLGLIGGIIMIIVIRNKSNEKKGTKEKSINMKKYTKDLENEFKSDSKSSKKKVKKDKPANIEKYMKDLEDEFRN